MFKREEKTADRYDSERNFKMVGYVSRELTHKSSKYRNVASVIMQSGLASGSKKSVNNLNSSQIYAQPQLVRPRRGASVVKNISKAKYAESMQKFRKEFVKNTNVIYEYVDEGYRKEDKRRDVTVPSKNRLEMGDEIGVEDLHYQMVKLHQNVKKMHHET